jgi:hypothetical protein
MDMNRLVFSLSALFFVVAFLILLDQYLRTGIWFQLKDIHHETFALASVTLAVGIFIGAYSRRNRKKIV